MHTIYKRSQKKKGTITLIKKKLSQKITEATDQQLTLTSEEKDYAIQHQLLPETANIVLVEKDQLFTNAIIERFDKETEELISKDSYSFLQTSLVHFKEKLNEFLYLESPNFDVIGVDAIAVEYDEVFEVYTAMFGLAVQKKFGPAMKDYLDEHFHAANMNYSIMFAGNDGLWEVNLPLNYIDQFNENFTIEEAYVFLYSFIFSLVSAIEN